MPAILLIEDNEQSARLVQKVLEPNGYTIHHAANGLTGLKLAREMTYDMILVDMDLPDLEGKVVVVQLRSTQTNGKSIIVAFTAEIGARAKRLALALGCDDFIGKPIDTRTFADQMNTIVGEKKLKTQTRPVNSIDIDNDETRTIHYATQAHSVR